MFHHFFANSLPDLIIGLLQWSTPNYWIGLGLALFVVGLVHPVPWELRSDEHSTVAHFLLHVRRFTLKFLLAYAVLGPIFLATGFCLIDARTSREALKSLWDWAVDRLADFGILVLAACAVGFGLRWFVDRHVMPRWSAYWRARRQTQDIDKPVDARDEAGSLTTRDFVPEKYFRAGEIFYALDEDGRPITLPVSVFVETHHAFLGPTSYGKGALSQTILQQVVRLMMSVFYIDAKGDDFLPYVLRDEAQRAGRPFVYLDLNPEGPGAWHPFVGGDARRRRARIVNAFNLAAGGTNADVYKARERGLLDQALSRTDGTIRKLHDAIVEIERSANGGNVQELSTLRDTLSEWLKVKTFASNRPGHSIERCLIDNAVVYVRGSMTDNVVKLATRAYIDEVCGELQRLCRERPAHCVLGIPELKFVASNELAGAIATIRGFRANLLLDAQSLANLLAPDDHRVNGKSLVQEFTVNTMAKFIYKAADEETKEWVEGLSGTQFLTTLSTEVIDVNKSGGEQWEARRTLRAGEHPIISGNTALYLPKRVAVAFLPGRLPEICYTSPVPTDRTVPIGVETANPLAGGSDDAPGAAPETTQRPAQPPASTVPAARPSPRPAPAAPRATPAAPAATKAAPPPRQATQNGTDRSSQLSPKSTPKSVPQSTQKSPGPANAIRPKRGSEEPVRAVVPNNRTRSHTNTTPRDIVRPAVGATQNDRRVNSTTTAQPASSLDATPTHSTKPKQEPPQ
jgi:hypothetical protein